MSRGLGRALRQAVSREGADADLHVEGRSLANGRRRQVFRYLCLRPCARVGDVCRDLRMSQATVRWHAWDLVEKDYLQVEGNRVFPSGLIVPEDAALFASLASTGRAAILAMAHQSPGISFQELAERVRMTRQSVSKIVDELSEFGLMNLIEDGRYRRVYPTDLLVRRREANRARADAFGESLVRRLTDEGLSPELIRRDETTLIVRLGAKARRVLLEVPLDPYTTAWIRAA